MLIINRNTYLILSLIAMLFFTFPSFGQEITFKHLTVENGLSNNKVNCILEDRFGFIWFGTEDGLNRFDGYDLKIYRHKPDDKNSISSNDIWALFEDKDGFIWIGTKAGEINRYDPQTDNFVSWKVRTQNINENSVTNIYINKNGRLWIGTYKNGLYQFDPKEDKFLNWQYDPNNKNSLSNNYITSILEDDSGNLWISTYNGLNKINPSISKDSFTRYYHDPHNTSTISNNLIWDLTASKIGKNKFWVGTAGGLNLYNYDNSSFSTFIIPEDKKLQFSNSVGSIIEDQIGTEKIYWIGTYAGLLKINPEKKEFKRFLYDEKNPFSLSSNQINKMLKDKSGVIWIATENGVDFISTKEARFNLLISKTSGDIGFDKLSGKNITSILENNDGAVIVGASQGIWLTKKINNKNQFNYIESSNNINVWSLCEDKLDKIWAGTYGQGLKEVDLRTNLFTSVEIKSKINIPSNFKYIKSLLKDKYGNLWIGSWGSGLARYAPGGKDIKVWINDPDDARSLSYNDIWVIYQDSRDNIWIGTNGGGLNLIDKNNDEQFFKLANNANSQNSLSSNSIYAIYESPKDKELKDTDKITLWIGTSIGLNKVTINTSDFKTDVNQLKAKVKVYTTKDGLPDNSIKSIIEDVKGNLWLGTSNGLSQFNPETEKFINYSKADGLNGNDFNFCSALKSKKGLLLFGSTKGLNIFDPNLIKQSTYAPPIVITDFKIFNQSIPVGNDSPLKSNITLTDEIVLSHDQNIFSFQFAALDFNSSSSNQYAYKMEGFDENWIFSGTRRYAAYTNLNTGAYYFKVKATNSDGVWFDSAKTIKVIITPPWWKTFWAYTIYLLIIFLGLYGIRRFELNLMKLRNELKMREFESKKHREIEGVKSRFFANLSHEFRTPLMLIKGQIERLREGKSQGNLQAQYDMIYRNTVNLHTLIDQLLELTQLEAESIPIKARKENIITTLKGIFNLFKSIAEQKNITLEFLSNETSLCVWVDRDKLEKIINNLLSNAIKFTPDGGRIILGVKSVNSDKNNFAEIKITDSGIGIPEDKLERIFDRFYQVDDSSGRAYGGSGIGLSLVKELVDLHKWEINIESEISKGTTFTLTIPLSDSYLTNEQKINNELNTGDILVDQQNFTGNRINKTYLNNTIDNENIIEAEKVLPNKSISKNHKPSILVVEDSTDVREYIFSLLNNDYNIIQAENAEDGMAKVLKLTPDLILSDIMMPGTDGLEFCKQLKTNFQTSHIPVILLTAKVTQANKIEGLETGADDYVLKPFNFKELSLRIKNLLEQRKLLKEKFSKEIYIQPGAVTVNSLDKEFLEKSLKVVESNLYNTQFDLEAFSREMFLSRSQLHRKMVGITGQAPGEFIRVFRLKKAAQLLLEKKLSVTQIALEIGFNSPSHFTKAFQQYFNCLPSEFTVQNNSK